MRIGHGFDVHAFGGEGPIIIGGVRIPYEKGLLAHSDGDVALHALTDALLGAAALGDIFIFPTSLQKSQADPQLG
ncbi:2-C-methyl-D-erythritol 2,4-cyclodiphosphate synthase, partial [Klebsiella pneumoniae]|uniref:2-C-methyl-D-erythritol 2,4-cyclodiphosphate synthase n=1 Tax=Klebsiella pneumoniae TaxID=573 RepID=UPI0039697BF1